eukprot:10901861-Lingulodinium_polyedra.AAC.1
MPRRARPRDVWLLASLWRAAEALARSGGGPKGATTGRQTTRRTSRTARACRRPRLGRPNPMRPRRYSRTRMHP